jgi:predicted DNA-binding protein (MmcQ/YjbR family)
MPSTPPFSTLNHYLLARPGATVDYPFDETTRVYRVGGKMFALLREDQDPMHINLKCDPADALALRAEHAAILPGYHMSKKHWNTVILDGSLPDDLVYELIDHSSQLVLQSLPKSQRQRLDRQ